MEEFKGSPYRRRGFDIESGDAGGSGERHDDGDDEFSDSHFDILSTKNASIERLKRGRQAALVLNASRRFRYTLDLKKEEERQETVRRIRTHAQVIRAAYRFKEAGEKAEAPAQRTPSAPTGEYGVGQEDLLSMSRGHDFSLLQQLGGVAGLCEKLKTDSEKGIMGNDEDILAQKNAFGSNTYPRKNPRSFWTFLWEAWQDLTLVILIIAAAASLALGIKSEVVFRGALFIMTSF